MKINPGWKKGALTTSLKNKKRREKIIKETPEENKHCIHCKKILSEKQILRHKKYCSRSCCTNYNRFINSRYLNSLNRKRNKCLNCGKEVKRNKKKYCCKECSAKYISFINNKIALERGYFTGKRKAKKYLIEKYGRKCMICGITEWQGRPIVLILDHIDGIWYNNKIENLRIICSNCDANLPTYKSKNMGKTEFNRHKKNYKESDLKKDLRSRNSNG